MSETPQKDTISLTNARLASLAEGLASLDGLRTSAESFKPYKFDDKNETTWLIADSTDLVTDAVKKYGARKKILAVQHGVKEGMTVTAENQASIQAFLEDVEALNETVITLPLSKISRERLKVGKGEKENPIPPSVLAKLMPILEA